MGFGRRSLCACCSTDDDDDVPTHTNQCCTICTPHESFPCRILFFLLILALDVADLVSDWLLYVDVRITEEGLVYGPPDAAAIHALLAFSIIGTFTFIFETVNLWWEVFRNNPWLDADLVSAITTWIEDLPQIAINVYIALCREDPISVFQLSKATVILFSLLIRIIMSLVKYCNKAALHEARLKTTESRRHVVYRVFIMLGLLINAGCAITIFIFTQTQRTDSGNLNFQVPESVFEDRYNDRRYFQNVGVFVHLPDFDQNTPDEAQGYRANWVHFMLINNIRNQKDLVISYNYTYLNDSSFFLMAFSMKEDKWSLPACYQMDRASRIITDVDNVTCMSRLNNSKSVHVYITFSFTPADKLFRKYIFGDIRFNTKVFKDGRCTESDQFTNDVGKNVDAPAIHYYRINKDIHPSNVPHLLMNGSQPQFYRDGTELQDIREVWKTGWGGCQSSGSMAPHLDRNIPIDC